jgi:hypothetical protein
MSKDSPVGDNSQLALAQPNFPWASAIRLSSRTARQKLPWRWSSVRGQMSLSRRYPEWIRFTVFDGLLRLAQRPPCMFFSVLQEVHDTLGKHSCMIVFTETRLSLGRTIFSHKPYSITCASHFHRYGYLVARRNACGLFTLVESDNVHTAWFPDKAKSVSDCLVKYDNQGVNIRLSSFVVYQFLHIGFDVLDILLTDNMRRLGSNWLLHVLSILISQLISLRFFYSVKPRKSLTLSNDVRCSTAPVDLVERVSPSRV